jgi:hypothetical protein
MSRQIAAYVCPQGVWAVECRMTRAGVEVVRVLEAPGTIGTAETAVSQLAGLLQGAGIKRAELFVTLRGFGVVHHVLNLPRARAEILTPVAERELRRLEPQLAAPIVGFIPLPEQDLETEAPAQRQFLVAGAPADQIAAFERGVRAAGHNLRHLTALPVAMQRVADEFEETHEAAVLVAPLPDGAFLGFLLAGGIRLVVEPPAIVGEPLDPPAIAEEVELGAMFIRQQFRGAQVAHVSVASSPSDFNELEGPFAEKLGVPVKRLAVRELGAAGLAALGAILDSRSAFPLGFAGRTRERLASKAQNALRSASLGAVFVLAAVAVFTVVEALRARDAANALQAARRGIEQQTFGLGSIRETAERRKLIRDAKAVIRLAAAERRELQEALTAVGSGVVYPVRLDSMVLDVGSTGWIVLLGGSVTAASNGRAVQALNDFYRDLPRRLNVESQSLEQLSYADSSADLAGPTVRFQLSFVIPGGKSR